MIIYTYCFHYSFVYIYYITLLLCLVFRVSFGSSKGSMVETLIYDSPPVQEEALDISDIDDPDG